MMLYFFFLDLIEIRYLLVLYYYFAIAKIEKNYLAIQVFINQRCKLFFPSIRYFYCNRKAEYFDTF
jgi:hypothetical protein